MKTLRITLPHGSKREVEWVGLDKAIGPKDKELFKPFQAQKCEPSGERQAQLLETSGPIGREVLTCGSPSLGRFLQVGESSGTSKDAELPRVEDSSSDEDESDGEVPEIGELVEDGLKSTSLKASVEMEDMGFRDGIAVGKEVGSPKATSELVLLSGEEFQSSWKSFPAISMGGSKSEMRPNSLVEARDKQNLPLVVFGEWEEEVTHSPTSCEPLCQLKPFESRLLVVDPNKAVGAVEVSLKSNWSDDKMGGFSKYVVFL
ncbi:hypothetical protein FCV25MIE_34346 [Fagus crenata]